MNKSLRTNEIVQGNLLHDYERTFANLPDHLVLIKLCSTVGITKTVAMGHNFTTLDDAELEKLVEVGLMSRVHFSSRRPVIRSDRMHSWEHDDRSSFGGGCCSSSRTLRNRDHDPILYCMMELVLG